MILTKRKFSLLMLIMAFIMVFSAGCFEPAPNNDDDPDDPGINQPGDDNPGDDNPGDDNIDDPERNVINIVGFGDSISAGYALEGSDMYSAYVDYTSGTTAVSSKCYTKLIANSLDDTYETVNVKNYAESGDKTGDLISKLNNTSAYPSLATDVQNADIITLCIGANDILGVALNNMADYLTGNITLEQINTMLDQGVANFKTNYTNTIMPYLTQGNGKVYVMTIYDPYKYFDTNEITITGENAFSRAIITYALSQFGALKETAINHLNEINEYIKNNSPEGVIVVDVNASFEALNVTKYRKYINADSSKITIDADTFSMEDASALQSNPNFDPHPTSQGQQFIANLFLAKINEQLQITNQE